MPRRNGSPRSAIDREERKHVRLPIAGAGFAGSVVAERLAGKFNKRVLICDRRPHIGGNAYDYYNEDGLLYISTAPTSFTPTHRTYSNSSRTSPNGAPTSIECSPASTANLSPFPINLDTVNTLYGLNSLLIN